MQCGSAVANAISPYDESVAYELLWSDLRATKKTIGALFRSSPTPPSSLVQQRAFDFDNDPSRLVVAEVRKRLGLFSAAVAGTYQFPERLFSSKYPLGFFYYRGNSELLDTPCVSVVGTRKPSPEGIQRARKLAKWLVERGFTIVSGLATGIDTAAHTATLEAGGNAIGVIGTPIDKYYPRENRDLQDRVARGGLLISQVPFYRYGLESLSMKKLHFLDRNDTMAALSLATIIVEAGETSGTLTQARACIQQGRKLFILNSCFDRSDLTWPAIYEKKGAVRVRDFSDIDRALQTPFAQSASAQGDT